MQRINIMTSCHLSSSIKRSIYLPSMKPTGTACWAWQLWWSKQATWQPAYFLNWLLFFNKHFHFTIKQTISIHLCIVQCSFPAARSCTFSTWELEIPQSLFENTKGDQRSPCKCRNLSLRAGISWSNTDGSWESGLYAVPDQMLKFLHFARLSTLQKK